MHRGTVFRLILLIIRISVDLSLIFFKCLRWCISISSVAPQIRHICFPCCLCVCVFLFAFASRRHLLPPLPSLLSRPNPEEATGEGGARIKKCKRGLFKIFVSLALYRTADRGSNGREVASFEAFHLLISMYLLLR